MLAVLGTPKKVSEKVYSRDYTSISKTMKQIAAMASGSAAANSRATTRSNADKIR